MELNEIVVRAKGLVMAWSDPMLDPALAPALNVEAKEIIRAIAEFPIRANEVKRGPQHELDSPLAPPDTARLKAIRDFSRLKGERDAELWADAIVALRSWTHAFNAKMTELITGLDLANRRAAANSDTIYRVRQQEKTKFITWLRRRAEHQNYGIAESALREAAADLEQELMSDEH